MLTRSAAVQRLLDLYEDPAYLEIGVNQGETFHAVTAAHKVAVDPQFQFVPQPGPGVEYHAVPSDQYFAAAPKDRVFEVIYLDGLHTFEQTLRDLLNATRLLREGGAILIDDVLPNSYDASLPDLAQVLRLREIAPHAPGATWPLDGSWMGDVFKVPFFIQSFMQQYAYATVAENHGQTVVWHQVRTADQVGQRAVEEVARLDYRDTILHRSAFNLLPFETILGQVEAALLSA